MENKVENAMEILGPIKGVYGILAPNNGDSNGTKHGN